MTDGKRKKGRRPKTKRDLTEAWIRSYFGGLKVRHHFHDVQAFCLFIGNARSGHSVIGSLISAHPEVVISHEIDILRYVRYNFSREQIFHLILQGDRDFTGTGRQVRTGFEYAVPEEWQGRFQRLRVIGDKRGGATTNTLDFHPEILDDLRNKVRTPLRLIHVVRNPFDNITTIAERSEISLDESIARYFRRTEAVGRIKIRAAGEVIDVMQEEFIADPRKVLNEILAFLGIDATKEYLDHCADVVYSAPNQSRHRGDWTKERIERVSKQLPRFDFLEGYSYSS